ncbi:MAG: nucleotidyltransferase domain-containing protein [Nanoarchaeota archaeon]|nr:nucleotidyltransferase domain-containing protein [Nanoarchaeota archaeon]
MDRKKTEIIALLEKFFIKAEKVARIEKVILFGSQATGKDTSNSDIDIMIISEDFKNKKSYKRAPQFYLLWDLPYDGDIICLTPEEFEKKKKQIGVVKTAVEEGIVVK